MKAYRLNELLSGIEKERLSALGRAWCSEPRDAASKGNRNGHGSNLAEELRTRMADEEQVRRNWGLLDELQKGLLERLTRRVDHCLPYRSLVQASSEVETRVESALMDLVDRGMLFPVTDPTAGPKSENSMAVPGELAATLTRLIREREEAPTTEPGTRLPFTLKDFLEAKHFAAERKGGAGEREGGKAAQHARQAYKLFLVPRAVLARFQRLPDELKELVEFAITRYGGLLPRSLYVKARGDDGIFEREELSKALEEALIGTVRSLDLTAYGVDLREETIVIFQEITMIFLRQRAAQKGQNGSSAQGGGSAQTGTVTPSVERVAGVDLATNVMRFLRYVDQNSVRFTVDGSIFKATHKRILSQLIPSDDGEDIERSFRFIELFCRTRHLVEPTGERTLRVSESGRAFENKSLPEKLKDLLAFAIGDPGCGGDPFHQVKLRRILIRLLRRLDPMLWYDAMYVPFLARNSHLAQMELQGVADYYSELRDRGRFALLENLQKLSWHLFHWVRTRLHLLGIVDLGFEDGHPTALRLSELGSSLLAGVPAQAAEGARSSLVVNPDFEVLLFPEADAYELVHTLDRFSRRTGSDLLFRFEISEDSVRSALADGMGVSEILEVLGDRCRTPLPQNVLYSLRDWADRAGLVTLDPERVLTARRPEILERMREQSRVRELTDPCTGGLKLRPEVSVDEFRSIVRDLGFHIEALGASEDVEA